MHYFSRVLIVFLGTVLVGCGTDSNSVGHDALMGRWELSKATVDGKDTDRLQSLYYVFLPDTSVQTNILGSETNFKYIFNSVEIEQLSEDEMDAELQRIEEALGEMEELKEFIPSKPIAADLPISWPSDI